MNKKIIDEIPNEKVFSVFKKSKLVYLNPLSILLLVFFPFSIGYFVGNQYLLPLLTGVPAGIILISHLKKDEVFKSIIDMVLYVIWLSVIGIVLMYFFNDLAPGVILRGTEYWDEMVPWLNSEPSKEGTPSLFIPEHLKHTVIVSVASLVSAGMIGLLFGTVLMNYMNYYVANIMLQSDSPIILAFIGWHPWSVCRVIGFIILGCAFAWIGVSRLNRKSNFSLKVFIFLIIAGLMLEVVDIMLKVQIGASWRDLIVSYFS